MSAASSAMITQSRQAIHDALVAIEHGPDPDQDLTAAAILAVGKAIVHALDAVALVLTAQWEEMP